MPVIMGKNRRPGQGTAKCYSCRQMVPTYSPDDPDDDAGEGADDDDADHEDAGQLYSSHMDGKGMKCDASDKPVRDPQQPKTDGRVGRFERFDRATLKAPVRMDNGFLRVEGRIAKTGIQIYRDSKGGTRRELRLPEEVFDQASLDSFQLVPVTNQHPPGMLTAQNAKKYQVGSVGEDVRRDGEFVVAPLMITDAEAISAAEQGRVQLSNGYSCRLDDADPSLFAMWGEHDNIQREIRGNHCAMVDVARAGPEARMRLDGSDAEAVYEENVRDGFAGTETSVLASNAVDVTKRPETRTMPYKLTMDGMEFVVEDKNAQAVYDRSMASVKEQLDAATQKAADRKTKLVEAQGKYDALEALRKQDEDRKIDCVECDATGQVHGAKCQNCDGAKSYPVKLDTADKRRASFARAAMHGSQKRAALMVEAQGILGTNEKLDGKSDTEIKQAVLAKLAPSMKFDGYQGVDLSVRVDASYATVLATNPKVSEAAKARQGVMDAGQVTGLVPGEKPKKEKKDDIWSPSDDPELARQRMVKRMLKVNNGSKKNKA